MFCRPAWKVRSVAWCCRRDGTGSRHLVPMERGRVRRLARSRDGARKGAVSASTARRWAPRVGRLAFSGAGEAPR